jgi:hypothetical protein
MRFVFLIIILLSGCGHQLVRDFNEASIDQGYKRVETIVCDRHDVGENGCVFQEGELLGELKIFVVNSGSINISGCGNDVAYRYANTGWFSIDLEKVVDRLDCSLDIFVSVDFPRQSQAQFPIRGMIGTVTLGSCPKDVICSFDSLMLRESQRPVIDTLIDDSGEFLVRSCGQELRRDRFNGKLQFELSDLVLADRMRAKDGCTAIVSVRGSQRYKKYYKIWFYAENTIPVQIPALEFGSKVKFISDKSVTLSVVNNKMYGQNGSFKPTATGDFLRFYTTQGRSLVMFLKDGEIVWIK